MILKHLVPPHAYFSDGPVKKVLIDEEQHILFMEVLVRSEGKDRLQPVLWQPQWESFGGMDAEEVHLVVVVDAHVVEMEAPSGDIAARKVNAAERIGRAQSVY